MLERLLGKKPDEKARLINHLHQLVDSLISPPTESSSFSEKEITLKNLAKELNLTGGDYIDNFYEILEIASIINFTMFNDTNWVMPLFNFIKQASQCQVLQIDYKKIPEVILFRSTVLKILLQIAQAEEQAMFSLYQHLLPTYSWIYQAAGLMGRAIELIDRIEQQLPSRLENHCNQIQPFCDEIIEYFFSTAQNPNSSRRFSEKFQCALFEIQTWEQLIQQNDVKKRYQARIKELIMQHGNNPAPQMGFFTSNVSSQPSQASSISLYSQLGWFAEDDLKRMLIYSPEAVLEKLKPRGFSDLSEAIKYVCLMGLYKKCKWKDILLMPNVQDFWVSLFFEKKIIDPDAVLVDYKTISFFNFSQVHVMTALIAASQTRANNFINDVKVCGFGTIVDLIKYLGELLATTASSEVLATSGLLLISNYFEKLIFPWFSISTSGPEIYSNCYGRWSKLIPPLKEMLKSLLGYNLDINPSYSRLLCSLKEKLISQAEHYHESVNIAYLNLLCFQDLDSTFLNNDNLMQSFLHFYKHYDASQLKSLFCDDNGVRNKKLRLKALSCITQFFYHGFNTCIDKKTTENLSSLYQQYYPFFSAYLQLLENFPEHKSQCISVKAKCNEINWKMYLETRKLAIPVAKSDVDSKSALFKEVDLLQYVFEMKPDYMKICFSNFQFIPVNGGKKKINSFEKFLSQLSVEHLDIIIQYYQDSHPAIANIAKNCLDSKPNKKFKTPSHDAIESIENRSMRNGS